MVHHDSLLIFIDTAFYGSSRLVLPRLASKLLPRISSLTFGDQAADNEVLALEAFLPALEALHGLRVQAGEVVEGTVQILSEDLLVEAVKGEAAAGVAAGEVLVGAAGAVEVAAGGDVEDAAAHGQVDGHAVVAVVGQQGVGSEGAEDDGGRLARQGRRGRGFVV